MKKDKIKNIIFMVVLCLVTSSLTAYSVSSTFDSSNVCYQVDSNTQASVQDTIDDLYGRATDYSSLSSRIGNLEGYFKNNPTSYFDGNDLILGKTNTTTNTGLYLYNDNVLNGAIYTRDSDHALVLTSSNSKPLLLSGVPINLSSSNVEIMGTDITGLAATGYTTPTPVSGVAITSGGYVKIGKLVIVNIHAQITSSFTSNLYGGVNNRVVIIKNLPQAILSTELITSYPSSTNAAYMVSMSNTVDAGGNLSVTFNPQDKYTTGWGLTIVGSYICK